jgi:two-component system sensor histidine kinase and response regulator WspE
LSDLSRLSLFQLFRLEVDEQARVLTDGLLTLVRAPADARQLESCMRAAHSLRGAARIVMLPGSEAVARSMEDCFVAAQQGKIELGKPQIDLLSSGVDLLGRMACAPEGREGAWKQTEIDALVSALTRATSGGSGDGGQGTG